MNFTNKYHLPPETLKCEIYEYGIFRLNIKIHSNFRRIPSGFYRHKLFIAMAHPIQFCIFVSLILFTIEINRNKTSLFLHQFNFMFDLIFSLESNKIIA